MLSVRDGEAKVNLQWNLRQIFQHVILQGDDIKSGGGIAVLTATLSKALETRAF
jgi:hypothetical protein